MPIVTITISDAEMGKVEQAQAVFGDEFSSRILRHMERELEVARAKKSRLLVTIYNEETGRNRRLAFEGRWLVGNEREGDWCPSRTHENAPSGHYSVALTKRGGIVVVEFNRHQDAVRWEAHEDYDDFAGASDRWSSTPLYPEALIQTVAHELGIERVEEIEV